MDWRWDTIHNQFSQAVLLLSGLHLAINWDWVLAAGQTAASGKARFEIGSRIVAGCSPLAGCRCICRLDGNV
jgi:hypothetical protein